MKYSFKFDNDVTGPWCSGGCIPENIPLRFADDPSGVVDKDGVAEFAVLTEPGRLNKWLEETLVVLSDLEICGGLCCCGNGWYVTSCDGVECGRCTG